MSHAHPILPHHYKPDLHPCESIYKHLHSHPELSDQESETATYISQHLTSLSVSADLEIKTHIGGYGLVAVCRNGDGKTVLLRADVDGLPVEEKTGLSYASHKKMEDRDGEVRSVMHGE